MRESYFGRGSGTMVFSQLRCTDSDDSLINCPFNLITSEHCANHINDAGVTCTGIIYITQKFMISPEKQWTAAFVNSHSWVWHSPSFSHVWVSIYACTMLSLRSPVHQVEMICLALLCICITKFRSCQLSCSLAGKALGQESRVSLV